MVSQIKTRMDRYGMFAVAGAAAAAAGGAHTADAAVVSSGVQNIDIIANGTGTYIDIDGDGTDDANFFYYNGPGTGYNPVQLFFAPNTTSDTFAALNDGTYITNLSAGDVVDASGFTTAPTFAGLIGYGYAFGEEFNPPNNAGFVGISFDISGATHYGWIELADLTESAAGDGFMGTVVQWAYEDVAGTAITVVPEPGSLALLALGAAGMLTRRKKSA